MLICAIVGVTIERVAYKPLRNAPRISALITAIGMSMFLSNLFKRLFGYGFCLIRKLSVQFPIILFFIRRVERKPRASALG